jgi:hypothetical protein
MSFFCHNHAPSMDRNWHGSNPLSNRYRIAIDRGRPDPPKIRASGIVPAFFFYTGD